MPLLEIAVAQSSFQNSISYPRWRLFINGKGPNYSLLQYEERWASFQKSFQSPGNLNFHLVHCKKSHPKFLIKAVATLEPKCPVQSKDGKKEGKVLSSTVQSLSSTDRSESEAEDPEEVEDKERLRRLRISKANKGNTPWNKGKKHSPETLQRIRERTRLAMQDPKVKMKLANKGHAQSIETREKIAAGVRMGWQRRREKLLLQETCLFDWQNLIAEAARKGFYNEEELQWDSYKILNDKLQQEWLASIEYRKSIPRTKGSKRAPKSAEQRRKIAEAIAAKWADPEYRSKVCSGLAKYHGTPEGAERKARRKPSGEAWSTRTSKRNVGAEKSSEIEMKLRSQQSKLKKRTAPKYKDPLAKTKLEMLKSIRAQRLTSETKKNEALQRARLLIAEAQNAAKALEVAATKSPVAQASLVESRKLIAEAIESIKSIESGGLTSQDDLASENQNFVRNHEEILTVTEEDNELPQRGLNGIASVQTSEGHNPDLNLYSLTMLDKMDRNYQPPTSLSGCELPKLELDNFMGNSDSGEFTRQHQADSNGTIILNGISSYNGAKLQFQKGQTSAVKTATKKWVRGRLVEVAEGE